MISSSIDTISTQDQAFQARDCVRGIDALHRKNLNPCIICPNLYTSNQLLFTACWIQSTSSGSFGFRGSGGSGDVILIILALLFSTIVSAGMTISRGIEAKENKDLLKKAGQGIAHGSTEAIQKVYKKALPFLERQCINSYLKTGLTFTLTVGLSLLTTALIMSNLSGHTYLISPHFLALLGAGIVGAATIGFVAKNTTLYALSFTEKHKKEAQELYESLSKLNKETPLFDR